MGVAANVKGCACTFGFACGAFDFGGAGCGCGICLTSIPVRRRPSSRSYGDIAKTKCGTTHPIGLKAVSPQPAVLSQKTSGLVAAENRNTVPVWKLNPLKLKLQVDTIDVSRKPAALKLHLKPRHLSRSGVRERRNERKAIETGVEITGRGVGRLVGGPVGSWVTSSAGRIGNGAILRVSRESNTLDERETFWDDGERLRDCK